MIALKGFGGAGGQTETQNLKQVTGKTATVLTTTSSFITDASDATSRVVTTAFLAVSLSVPGSDRGR